MGGFVMGQMFLGQSKTVLFNFVSLRFDRDIEIIPVLEETIKDSFFDSTSQVSLKLEFTQKAELKVWNKPKKRGNSPSLVFPMCYYAWTKKDAFLCIAIRNEAGMPLTMNMSLLRNFLKALKSKKIKVELW
jgi:hypothetical protein